jgi:hypothetical protein
VIAAACSNAKGALVLVKSALSQTLGKCRQIQFNDNELWKTVRKTGAESQHFLPHHGKMYSSLGRKQKLLNVLGLAVSGWQLYAESRQSEIVKSFGRR